MTTSKANTTIENLILAPKSGIVVLSLFDGISAAQQALKNLKIPVKKYYASEIDAGAIKVTQSNFADTIQLGDVTKIKGENSPNGSPNGLPNGSPNGLPKIDLLIGGSPCKDLTILNSNRDGLKGEQSKLFWHFVRIKKEANPRYFLLENVASMKDVECQKISKALGVQPVLLNSADFSAQQRKRYYWTNLKVGPIPTSNHQCLKDILTGHKKGTNKQCYPETKLAFRIPDIKFSIRSSVYDIYGKSPCLVTKEAPKIKTRAKLGYRSLNVTELERLQVFPDHYTKAVGKSKAIDLLGQSFTVKVIEHLLGPSLKRLSKSRQLSGIQQKNRVMKKPLDNIIKWALAWEGKSKRMIQISNLAGKINKAGAKGMIHERDKALFRDLYKELKGFYDLAQAKNRSNKTITFSPNLRAQLAAYQKNDSAPKEKAILNKSRERRGLLGTKSNDSQIIDMPGFVLASAMNKIEKPETFKLPGQMGDFLQNMQAFRLAITLKGDKGSGKTTFITQLIDSFLDFKKTVGFFSLEQGGLESKDTQQLLKSNIKPKNLERLAVTGEAENGIQTVKQYANTFDVVVIDSWQKLQKYGANVLFDELRMEYPHTIWVVIFQENAAGGTRGGVAADYDAPIVLKSVKVGYDFTSNYIFAEKNRGNPLDRKYLVASKQTSNLYEPVKKEHHE
ncbi:MAG: DNA cytosine methyltransferase [Bacteroidota bacterium]